MKRISVIGFGKIGQAIAANILQHDIPVLAIDINPAIGHEFTNGTFSTNEPGLEDILKSAYASGQLIIDADFFQVANTSAIIIAIPLMIDENKQLLRQPFADCIRRLSPYCTNNILIVIETSVPVGFSRSCVEEVLTEAGKLHGSDYLLANSPERIKSNTMLEQLKLIPKVIGGLTDEATERAIDLYARFFPKNLLHTVPSIEAAEMLKLAGMIYRDINIALANQLAQFADAAGIAYADLIPLINTDREANLLQPGIGVGGHCTPVYPYFLIDNFREANIDFALASLSRKINDGMADYALSLVRDRLVRKEALILGLSFRPNVKEDSLSTAYLLNDALKREGIRVWLHDVEYAPNELKERGFEPVSTIYDSGAEALFLVTMHDEYDHIDFGKLAAGGVKWFVDGRNSVSRERVEAAGIGYFGIGR